MGMIHTGRAAPVDAMAVLVAGLEGEFGKGAGAALADRFFAAEDTEFHWDSRQSERFLGSYFSADDEDLGLDRVAICGRLDAVWFAAIVIMDRDGQPHGMIGRRGFGSEAAALEAWPNAH